MSITRKNVHQTCSRRLQFCSGHRVMNHESKCAHMHGHNYVVHLKARAAASESPLDDIGRVIDFSVLKAKIGGWIETAWDHGYLLWEKDFAGQAALRAFEEMEQKIRGMDWKQKLYLLPYNPTAENMALYLLEVVCPRVLAGTGVEIVNVTVEETENCLAEATLVTEQVGE